jgi:uncharacterized protein HemY
MANTGLFSIVFFFNLAVLSSLASLGNKIYHSIILSKYLKAMTKISVVIVMTISAFLIVLFLLEIFLRLTFFM